MSGTTLKVTFYAAILAIGLFAPFVFPAYTNQISLLWLMIVFALTWDILGGQMGYNSLGNIFFFGAGMYASALLQIGIVHDVGEYTAAFGGGIYEFTEQQYFTGIVLGMLLAGILSAVFAVVFGWVVFGLRGP